MAETEDVERAVDELFTSPPEGFTEARNALAKRLKDQGDAGSARRVGGLRKPVRSAWAVNRLAHEDRSAVEELLQVGKHLRLAQRRALSGGDAEELRRRAEERRKLVTELTRRAARDLGKDPTPAVVAEVAATLEAASADEDAARQLLEGRLSKPFARPAGFGDVAGLPVVSGRGRGGQPRAMRTPGPNWGRAGCPSRSHGRPGSATSPDCKSSRERVGRLKRA